jgi:hypothetical protein
MAFVSRQETNAPLAAYLAPQRDRQLERLASNRLKIFFIVGPSTMEDLGLDGTPVVEAPSNPHLASYARH